MAVGAELAGADDTPAPAPRVPLLITAELPPDVLAWADALRRQHYPPERNRLRAHVTLFHALPPSAEAELRRLLAMLAAAPPPQVRISGIMNLGNGNAIALESPEMVALHGEIAARMRGQMTRQDDRALRLHLTVQNKVSAEAARALRAELEATLQPRSFRFKALGLYGYHDGLWNLKREFPFRGAPQSRG